MSYKLLLTIHQSKNATFAFKRGFSSMEYGLDNAQAQALLYIIPSHMLKS